MYSHRILRDAVHSSFVCAVFAFLVSPQLLSAAASKGGIDPFAVNDGNIPSKEVYKGALFRFNYNYPHKLVTPTQMPWRKLLKGKPLSKDKAHDYIMALKTRVSKSMRTFVTQPEQWNKSAQEGWYSMLWAGEEVKKTGWEGREAIYGTYTGQILPASTYKASGLKVDIRNHAAIYYDTTAAYTLHKVWEKCKKSTGECVPSTEQNEAQFQEGAIIIKAAGATATPQQWPVMEGAAKWQVFRKPFDLKGTIEDKPAVVTDIRIAIFDIIVKDSIASPETGWVFSTLVYDKDAKGDDAWDKMVPLGAIWGNDPDVNSAKNPHQELQETYVNPNAPAYSTVTLGYGGRLSGPFDIAVKTDVMVDGKLIKSLRSSSCLSCHGTTSYKPNDTKTLTFFYPAKMPISKPWEMYIPGSAQWNEWFQNRWGSEPQSKVPGAIALDYSTFLQAALMNYTATASSVKKSVQNSKVDDLFWEKWRQWQKELRH